MLAHSLILVVLYFAESDWANDVFFSRPIHQLDDKQLNFHIFNKMLYNKNKVLQHIYIKEATESH